MDAFFERDGDRFVSTEWTRGPWDPRSQHGGPPAALAGWTIERLPADVPMRVSRFTIEILRPIPVTPLRVDARVARNGKRVQMCEAAVTANDDVVAIARAWRIRASSDSVVKEVTDGVPPPDPSSCPELVFPEGTIDPSYMKGMEWRTASGSPFRAASCVWFRMRHPLVAGEPVTPLSRVLAAADSGNGISAVLDFSMLFINTELTVHVICEPVGEWVAVDATTRIDPAGIGVAQSSLWDERGRLGFGAQSLYVGKR